MDIWRDIRLKARQYNEDASRDVSINSAIDLVRAGLRKADLQLDTLQPHTVYGEGVLGVLEREDGFVRIAEGLDHATAATVIAHELGHFWLHDESKFIVRETDASFGGQPFECGIDRVVAYSPKERREVQANVFAQEFLLPAHRLRTRFLSERARPSAIAQDFCLPPGLVIMQMIRALLLPPLRPSAATTGSVSPEPLDPSQQEAATWSAGPLIVDAGPGTGKTKTLVGRIEHLLGNNVAPSSIIALTFSNKAAAEMIERVERLSPTAAPLIWIGTFHAFGLEILRLFGATAGIQEDFGIADEAESLAVLERALKDLPLRYYQNLWDPTLELRFVLHAISRAKDELVSAEEYGQKATEMRRRSQTSDEIEKAERAVEVGQIYTIYEQRLRAENLLDFGDLVGLAARVLRLNPDALQQLSSRFAHILVDEYQDVNFASTELLKVLRPDGKGMWVVADPRQSIYRFRGAAPGNVSKFATAYAAASRRPLLTNYRSGQPVVNVFQGFGAGIAAAPKPAVSWHANRGAIGRVEQHHADNLASEAAGLAKQIAQCRAEGIAYANQAVLARSHLTLARFAAHLETAGVPILYLGDLFERPEVRDLLSLVSLGSEFGGAGLVRVAEFPEYGASRADAVTVIAEAARTKESAIEVCARAATLTGVSEAGRRGLPELAAHLDGVGFETSAWQLLTRYLFEQSDYLAGLLAKDDVSSQQSLIAIYQILKFCREHQDAHRRWGERRALLENIRRLERLDDDRQYRIVPAEAEGIDAVRFMTIHASKGLEFGAVHLPNVATHYVPSAHRQSRCPPPAGLEHLALSKIDHDAEEECLFFVALSRARDVLGISHARWHTGARAGNPSRLLARIGSALPSPRSWPDKQVDPDGPIEIVPSARDSYEERHLQLYSDCPARYRYEVVDELRGPLDMSAYLRFHGCVRRTISWVDSEQRGGNAVTADTALVKLKEIWADRGPVGHGFEEVYLRAAQEMVQQAVTARTAIGKDVTDLVWRLEFAGKPVVAAAPDRAFEAPDGSIVIQRIRTGRRTKNEPAKPVWTFLEKAAGRLFAGRRLRLEAFYPGSGERVPIIPEQSDKALAMYENAVVGIERGEFPPRPSRHCPSCQFYFICTGRIPV